MAGLFYVRSAPPRPGSSGRSPPSCGSWSTAGRGIKPALDPASATAAAGYRLRSHSRSSSANPRTPRALHTPRPTASRHQPIAFNALPTRIAAALPPARPSMRRSTLHRGRTFACGVRLLGLLGFATFCSASSRRRSSSHIASSEASSSGENGPPNSSCMALLPAVGVRSEVDNLIDVPCQKDREAGPFLRDHEGRTRSRNAPAVRIIAGDKFAALEPKLERPEWALALAEMPVKFGGSWQRLRPGPQAILPGVLIVPVFNQPAHGILQPVSRQGP